MDLLVCLKLSSLKIWREGTQYTYNQCWIWSQINFFREDAIFNIYIHTVFTIWTIVNTVIGNQSLLDVSNWLDHLKSVCLDDIVLIVYIHYWIFRSFLYIILLLKAPLLPNLYCICPWMAAISIVPTVNHWLQLYYVVFTQPFHSSICCVHHSPSIVALMLSIIPLCSTLAPHSTYLQIQIKLI